APHPAAASSALPAFANSRSYRLRVASRRDQSDVPSCAVRLLLSEGAASRRRSATRRSTARRSARGAGVANSITACTPDGPTSLRAARPVSAKRSRSAMLTRLITGESKRSEEHTSELQSLAYLVCRLLLEKKKLTTI